MVETRTWDAMVYCHTVGFLRELFKRNQKCTFEGDYNTCIAFMQDV